MRFCRGTCKSSEICAGIQKFKKNHQVYRTAAVPKMASTSQIRDIALRRFHIQGPPDNYYVTQVLNDGEHLTTFTTAPHAVRILTRRRLLISTH